MRFNAQNKNDFLDFFLPDREDKKSARRNWQV